MRSSDDLFTRIVLRCSLRSSVGCKKPCASIPAICSSVHRSFLELPPEEWLADSDRCGRRIPLRWSRRVGQAARQRRSLASSARLRRRFTTSLWRQHETLGPYDLARRDSRRVLQTAGPKEDEKFERHLHENGEDKLAYAWSMYCFADPRLTTSLRSSTSTSLPARRATGSSVRWRMRPPSRASRFPRSSLFPKAI